MTTTTTTSSLTIATRQSPLAIWQAEFVRTALQRMHPGLEVILLGITSSGDQLLEAPLAKVGGKGLFVKELEAALLDGRADLAVHSIKDVPMELPHGLSLAVICEREDPSDALVCTRYPDLDALPAGSVVGTSSLRRECQLRDRHPDLEVRFLRGNVNSRLSKLDAGEYDAIILASAGLLRLGLGQRIAQRIPFEQSLPAAGQGAVGIEMRTEDKTLRQLLQGLHHQETASRVIAERAMTRRLQGGCQVPIAGYAELISGGRQLQLRGLVGRPDGSLILRAQAAAEVAYAEQLGVVVAEKLLAQGAAEILAAVYSA